MFDLLKELPAHGNFKDDVDMLLIIEAAKELDDIGVVEEHLDLDLANELLFDALLYNECLLNGLQGHYKATVFLSTLMQAY